MAVAAILVRRILIIANLQRFVGILMAAQANFIRRITGDVVNLSALFAVAFGAIRDKSVSNMAIRTFQLTMLAGVFL